MTFTFSIEDVDEPATTIVEAVSWAKNTEYLDLDPLQNVIDTESLAGVLKQDSTTFYRGSADSDSTDLQVSFRYEGCKVTVTRDQVRVVPDQS